MQEGNDRVCLLPFSQERQSGRITPNLRSSSTSGVGNRIWVAIRGRAARAILKGAGTLGYSKND
jgi:hypothetical protein